MTPSSHAESYASFLFVSAQRLDRVAKAFDSGAKHVIIDLEDTINHTDKSQVRDELLAFDGQCQQGYWVRINGVASTHHQQDLQLVAKLSQAIGVVLPKTQNANDVSGVYHATALPILAAIEDAQGLANVDKIAQADGLYTLTYGCLDLANSLGVRRHSMAEQAIQNHIRTQLVIHTKANGLHAPIETIYPDFGDDVGLVAWVRHWQDFGFGGQLLIHPRQVNVMHSVAGDDDVAFAKKVADWHDKTGQVAFAIDGQMVDLPVIEWAKAVLGRG